MTDTPSTPEAQRPPLLLLHGMFGRPADWEQVGLALGDDYRVLIPRLPVFDFPKGHCGLESLCDRVRGILDEHNIERVVLGGNSLGGHVATLAALAMPERVAALVLTGSSGLFERGMDKSFGGKVPRKPSREWILARVEEVFYDPVHITEELIEEIAQTVSQRRTVANVIRLARAIRRRNVRNELKEIQCPVTLIWGEEDVITPPPIALEFARELPNVSTHFLPRCGHTPPIERPKEFTAILRQELEDVVANTP